MEIPLGIEEDSPKTLVDRDRLAEVLGLGAVRDNGNGYAKTRTSDGNRFLHKVLFPVSEGLVVDHINGNPLDNRIQNLRSVTMSDNQTNRNGLDSHNTSGYRGVSWCKTKLRWRAYAQRHGKFHQAGYFKEIQEAAKAAEELRESLGFLN